MAHLYKSVSGRFVSAHSHSGGGDWACPRKYKYKRIDGWQSRDERPALEFGKCVEAALVYHHTTGFEPGSGVEEFKKLWWRFQNDDSFVYTEKSGNWEDHYRMGAEMLSLYEQIRPTLPLDNAKFSTEIRKELFSPGHEYEGLQYMGIIDILAEVPADHPLLPLTTGSQATRKIVIDIKTSANAYNADPRMSSLDDQLIDYSWITGIRDVAFLVFVKNASGVTNGDWVTVIRGPKAGKRYQVLWSTQTMHYLLPKSLYEEYNERKKGTKKVKGKTLKEQHDILLTEYTYKGYSAAKADVTKQSIQFLPAVISVQDMLDAEEVARQEAMEISACSLSNFFPKKPGVRFPHNQCLSCECLGLCIGDPKMVKEKLIQIDGVF